jgi:4-hydroxybenzoate polyprenyltransferase
MQAKRDSKTLAFIELLRPGWWLACFFIGLTPGMLAILWHTGSLNDFFQLKTIIWVFAYWASIVGIYVYNDVVGISEDAVINSKRPLPSKRIGKNGALAGSYILLTLGVGLWWITFQNQISTLIQLSCILLIVIYSAFYKNNILLGLGAGLIPIGVWTALAPLSVIPFVLFFILFFWELTLDVPENLLHYEGDVIAHPQTFAVAWGKQNFARMGLIFAIPVVLFCAWLFILLDMSYIFLIFAIFASVFIIYGTWSIRDNIKPVNLGKALGMAMLAIFLINIGIIFHTIIESIL